MFIFPNPCFRFLIFFFNSRQMLGENACPEAREL